MQERNGQPAGQPTPATGQVTPAERTTMHTQAALITDQLDTNPDAPMTEGTLVHLADRHTDSVRERQYLLASAPPATGMTRGEYANELRAANA